MASAAKIEANRRNAQSSTGPRSAAAKARTRYNARTHGLAAPKQFNRAAAAHVEALAEAFKPGDDPETLAAARNVVEAELELCRVRQVRVDLVNHAAARDVETMGWPAGARASAAFAKTAHTLAAVDRYERRALSHRNRAMRALDRMTSARRKAEWDEVGPPVRHRWRRMPFTEPVIELPVAAILHQKIKESPKNPTNPVGYWFFRPEYYLTGHAQVHHEAGIGDLTLMYRQQDDRCIIQTFALGQQKGRIGGNQWFVQCPETGRLVRALYSHDWEQPYFRSRHAAYLTYESKSLSKSEAADLRFQKLVSRIGGPPEANVILDREFPPRPQNMQRRTYSEIRENIERERVLSFCRHLGCPTPWETPGGIKNWSIHGNSTIQQGKVPEWDLQEYLAERQKLFARAEQLEALDAMVDSNLADPAKKPATES